MVYHPNLQCDCAGCALARKTITSAGTPVLYAKRGMPTCFADKCDMCKALRPEGP